MLLSRGLRVQQEWSTGPLLLSATWMPQTGACMKLEPL
jgi:hypothetical protein